MFAGLSMRYTAGTHWKWDCWTKGKHNCNVDRRYLIELLTRYVIPVSRDEPACVPQPPSTVSCHTNAGLRGETCFLSVALTCIPLLWLYLSIFSCDWEPFLFLLLCKSCAYVLCLFFYYLILLVVWVLKYLRHSFITYYWPNYGAPGPAKALAR